MRQVEDSEFPIDDEQADCLAPKWVDAIGYETLLEAGVTPEVLGGTEDGDDDADFEDVVDRPRAEKLIAAFGDCGIDLEELFFDGLASDGSATPDQVDCLRGRLPDGFVQDLMITSMDGGDDALDEDDPTSSSSSPTPSWPASARTDRPVTEKRLAIRRSPWLDGATEERR